MKKQIWFMFSFLLLTVYLAGCGGSNGPTTVLAPAGTGYSVGLQASTKTVLPGTSVQLTTWVYGPDGKLIMTDEDGVSFNANLSGTFENDGKAKIADGVGVTQFSFTDSSSADNPDPTRVLRITAVYRGAVSSIELMAVSKTF